MTTPAKTPPRSAPDRRPAAPAAVDPAAVEGRTVGRVDVAIKAAADTKEPNGEFEATLSAPTLDRDGEVIDAGAFNPLPDRIPIDIDHAMSVRGTVGSGQPYYDGDLLKFRGTFASTPLAQDVRALVTEGHVTKMSVAFMSADRRIVDGVPHIVAGELLNAAIVSIPSNRQADITAAKAAGLLGKDGARNSAEDQERLQTIHDLAVDNGAACAFKATPAAGTKTTAAVKTIPGSYEALRERLVEALGATNPDAFGVWIIATFDDHVVYELLDGDFTEQTYQADYTVNTDGAITLGDPEAVEVTETIQPVKTPGADPERRAAAPAPAEASLALVRSRLDELTVLVSDHHPIT